MRNIALIAAVLLAIAALFGSGVAAAGASNGKTKTIETKSQLVRARGDEDPNVKVGRPKANDPLKSEVAASATRGPWPGVCQVHVENLTGWFVDVYVDGTYRGQVGPVRDGYTFTGTGETAAYATADFTDGSRRSWGPVVFSCAHGSAETWTLHQ